MRVSVRTRLATAKLLWNRRSSAGPSAPSARADWYASFTCPRIWGSPSTIGIEAGSDAVEVPHGGAVLVAIQVFVQVLGREAMGAGQELARAGLGPGLEHGVDLAPVAGRDQRGLAHPGDLAQGAERVRQGLP
jgi:hypothetical protein